MLPLNLVLKDVLLDHTPTHHADHIACSCGRVFDVDHDQYIGHLLRDLTTAARTGRNPKAPDGSATRRPWASI